jgi:hypothetical protein
MPQLPAAIKKQVHIICRTERPIQQPIKWQKKKHAADVVLFSDAVQKITAIAVGAIGILRYLLPTLLSIACARNVYTKQQKKRSMHMLLE